MSLLRDIRLLRRAPASTGIALLSIALSVGATAVVFAAIKSVLIDPLPYARPSELVQLRSEYPRLQRRVGMREFREKLADYLESGTPLAITRHGETLGFYIPAQKRSAGRLERRTGMPGRAIAFTALRDE